MLAGLARRSISNGSVAAIDSPREVPEAFNANDVFVYHDIPFFTSTPDQMPFDRQGSLYKFLRIMSFGHTWILLGERAPAVVYRLDHDLPTGPGGFHLGNSQKAIEVDHEMIDRTPKEPRDRQVLLDGARSRGRQAAERARPRRTRSVPLSILLILRKVTQGLRINIWL